MRIALLLLLIIITSGCVQDTVYITKVIDGDTIETENGDIIRLLGINAPEKNKYYYEESTEYLRSLIENKYVTLESDQTDKDWYGRKLRYIYIGNNMINSEMLEKGYARLYLLNDQKYGNVFMYAEKSAKELHLGVWEYT